MNETSEDIGRLQALLTASIEKAGSYLRHSFEMPRCSLSATQLANYLQGVKNVALATTTAKGEPRVAPICAIFYCGYFYLPTGNNAARVKHVRRNPVVSLTYYEESAFAIIVHGHVSELALDQAPAENLEEILYEGTGYHVCDWEDGLYLRVNADTFYTFAQHPERYPD